MPAPITILPAIMSGGAGTRLWPASTDTRPKQFHAFGSPRSLFQDTVLRAQGAHGAIAFAPPVILGAARHGDLIEAQLREIGAAEHLIVLEPEGRNTAATAAVAAALAQRELPDALVLLAPADHIIADRNAFLAAIARAAPFARERIVTFGVTPTRAETGYGYIQAGASLGESVHAIAAFHEKPEAPAAENFIRAGGHYWNAGMFLFSPAVLLREFASASAIRDGAIAALSASARTGRRIVLADVFAAVESKPLDKAVMEKTAHGAVAPCDIGWADVGSWREIWRLSPQDSAGNAVRGAAVLVDARDNLIRSDGPRIAMAGVSGLIVVASGDTVLIVPAERAQDVKALWEKANAK